VLISPILSDLKPLAPKMLPIENLVGINLIATVPQRDVAECRRYTRNLIAYEAQRVDVESLYLEPTAQFIVLAITRNIAEK